MNKLKRLKQKTNEEFCENLVIKNNNICHCPISRWYIEEKHCSSCGGITLLYIRYIKKDNNNEMKKNLKY